MIKLATVFSGIGAVEHALSRMDIDNEIHILIDNPFRHFFQAIHPGGINCIFFTLDMIMPAHGETDKIES